MTSVNPTTGVSNTKAATTTNTTKPINTNESTSETKAATKEAASGTTSSPYIIPLPLLIQVKDTRTTFVPPLSFALVTPGIYRSACPSSRNFPFLHNLGLKSIVYLCTDEYPESNLTHFTAEGLEVKCFPLVGNKEPFVSSDFAALSAALIYTLDQRHQPVLVHCNKGKHRTGCFVGVLRRLSGISLAAAFAEYRQYIGASSVTRDLDRLMMECFNIQQFKKQLNKEIPTEFQPDWIQTNK